MSAETTWEVHAPWHRTLVWECRGRLRKGFTQNELTRLPRFLNNQCCARLCPVPQISSSKSGNDEVSSWDSTTGWLSGKSWGDIVIKAPAGGCVCWQQHSCIAHVWECWEWEIFCNKNPAWAKVQKEERGYRSSLAGDPPGEDLNSKLEATEQSVKGNNQAPTRQK